MNIIVASMSTIKINACKCVFPNEIITGVKSDSGVSDQPYDDETIQGALNRLTQIKQNEADIHIAIENGIFSMNEKWYDCPVIALSTPSYPCVIVTGEGVNFPAKYIRSSTLLTAGQQMKRDGLVEQHDDPHLELSGKPRIEYIIDTIRQAWYMAKVSVPLNKQNQ